MRTLLLVTLLLGAVLTTALCEVSQTTSSQPTNRPGISTNNNTAQSASNNNAGDGLSTWAQNLLANALGLLANSSKTGSQPTSRPPASTNDNTAQSASNDNAGDGLPAWAQNLFSNALGLLANSSSKISPDEQTGAAVGNVLSQLPGLFRGLGGLTGTGSDVSKVLTALFASPNSAGVPAWIQALTMGLNSSKALQNVGIIGNVLRNVGSVNDDKMQALLGEIFPDVAQGLASLNLTANSTGGEVLSAVFSNDTLLSSMSTVAQGAVAGLLSDPNMFPIDPTSTCAVHLQALAQGLINSEMWTFQMLDAMGKPMSGILTGQRTLFGDYAQCMDVGRKETTGVQGQFYVMHVNVGPTFPIKVHLCLPRSCEVPRLWWLFAPTFENLGANITNLEKLEPRDPSGDRSFLGIMITIATLCLLCAVGTMYGIFVDGRKERAKKAEAILPEKLTPNKNGHVNGGFTNHEAPNGDHVTKDLTNGLNGTSVQITNGNTAGGMVNGQKGGAGGKKPNGTAAKNQSSSGQEGLASKLLLSFSVLRNGRKLLDCTQNQSDITCIHGIRVLSITWVILGHCFQIGEPQGNQVASATLMSHITYMVIPGGILAVDTFFLLSGCLTSYLFLRTTKKSGLTVSGMVLYYWHRYWRLTPLYGLLVAFYIGVFPYLINGPFQNVAGADSWYSCPDNWYLNILYVNNFFPVTKMCFGWSWYLSNDMQFYVIAPICLIPWALKGRIRILGFVMAVALIVIHVTTTWVLAYDGDLSMFGGFTGDDFTGYFEKVYIKPWCRVGPYAVGLLLGYLMHATRCKYTMQKMSSFLGWFLASAAGLTLIYVQYDNLGDLLHGLGWNAMDSAAYDAVSKIVWAFCVSWVIFACSTGHGGFVNTILSWSAWAPLSRMSYGVYLVHLVVLQVLEGNMKRPFYMDGWTGTSLVLAVTVLSYLSTFVFSLMIEAPSLGVEKAVMGKVLRRKN